MRKGRMIEFATRFSGYDISIVLDGGLQERVMGYGGSMMA